MSQWHGRNLCESLKRHLSVNYRHHDHNIPGPQRDAVAPMDTCMQ